jgi:hypothetical protein
MKIASVERVDAADPAEVVRPRHHAVLMTTRTDGTPQASR